jgi:hypothetical protein
MEPDLLLAHLLRLRAAMDCALEAAVPVSDDDVYLLLGLVDELDRAMRSGAGVPSRWRPPSERRSAKSRAFSLDLSVAPGNDNASRRRRARVRGTRVASQLALPWVG